MATRLTGTFKSPATSPVGPDYLDQFTVSIQDNTFGGDPSTIIINSCKILWDSEKGDDRHAAIIGSRATVVINVDASDSTLTTFIEDFAYGEDARFLLEITKDDDPVVVWRGVMKSDQSGEDDITPFDFRVSAVCGLGLLKDIPYHTGTELYTGIERLTNHLCIALRKMPHSSIFWDAGDPFLRTSVDWWSASMASGADDDALYQAGVDHTVFYDFQKQGGIDEDALSCYDVLSHIVKTFGCRIYQNEGVYRVEQIPYRSESSFYIRDYDRYGDFIESAVSTAANVINQTTEGAKITLINYDYLPILKKVEVTYDVKTRRNFLNGFNLQSGGLTSIPFPQAISANGGDAIMRLSGTVSFTIRNLAYSSVGDVLFWTPYMILKVGDNYLKREYTIVNYTAQLKAPVWTGTAIDSIFLPHSIGPVGDIGTSISGTFNFEILSPPLPDDAEENGLSFNPGASLIRWNGTATNPSDFQILWSASNLFLEVYDEGTPIVDADQVVYTATNPLDATENYKTTVRLGSELLPNSAGRLFRWGGAAWLTAPLWGQGAEARTRLIGDILATNILNGQDTPRRRMNGTIYGNLKLYKYMQTSEGRHWLFSRVDWDLAQNSMSGSWIELNYGVDGVSATPIKKKLITNGPTYPPGPDPVDPNGLTSNNPGFVVNPPPTVIAPIAYNALDTRIFEGDTITSIPIKTASEGNEFLTGDKVTITNPYTGVFQDFTISTPPEIGDTSLSVTSAASLYDFPEDSYLTIKQKAYSFRPAKWYTFKGNIGATTAHRVFVTGFDLPANDDACFAIVRRQIYQSPDDYTLNLVDNSLDFLSSLNLNGQVAYVKAYA